MLETRELNEMPFDKTFINSEGNQVLCHATGYEVAIGDPSVMSNWWNEYVDNEDNIYYGR